MYLMIFLLHFYKCVYVYVSSVITSCFINMLLYVGLFDRYLCLIRLQLLNAMKLCRLEDLLVYFCSISGHHVNATTKTMIDNNTEFLCFDCFYLLAIFIYWYHLFSDIALDMLEYCLTMFEDCFHIVGDGTNK